MTLIKLFLICLILLGISFFSKLIIDLINYLCAKSEKNALSEYKYKKILIDVSTLPRFTFSQFLKFYNLNPDSWEFMNKENYFEIPAKVEYKEYKTLIGLNTYTGYKDYYYHPIFFTNMFEYFKYKKWAKDKFKEVTKKANMERQTNATKEFVALVQEDIDAIRSENERILQETEDTLCKSLTNLRREEKERKMVDGELCESTVYCGVESNGKPVRAYVSTKYNENM